MTEDTRFCQLEKEVISIKQHQDLQVRRSENLQRSMDELSQKLDLVLEILKNSQGQHNGGSFTRLLKDNAQRENSGVNTAVRFREDGILTKESDVIFDESTGVESQKKQNEEEKEEEKADVVKEKPLIIPVDVGEQIASILLEKYEQGGGADSIHQGLLFPLCSLCPQDVLKILTAIFSQYGIEMFGYIRDFLGVRLSTEDSDGKFLISAKLSTKIIDHQLLDEKSLRSVSWWHGKLVRDGLNDCVKEVFEKIYFGNSDVLLVFSLEFYKECIFWPFDRGKKKQGHMEKNTLIDLGNVSQLGNCGKEVAQKIKGQNDVRNVSTIAADIQLSKTNKEMFGGLVFLGTCMVLGHVAFGGEQSHTNDVAATIEQKNYTIHMEAAIHFIPTEALRVADSFEKIRVNLGVSLAEPEEEIGPCRRLTNLGIRATELQQGRHYLKKGTFIVLLTNANNECNDNISL